MDRDNQGRFKKGDNKGANNHKWRGDKIKYGSVHDYIAYHYGRPQICEKCGAKNLGSRKHQWANISGKYKRDRSDWLRLCAKCHFKYDDRIKNLLPRTNQPIREITKRNTTGYKNVRLTKSGKYRPYITISKGKQKFLGTYNTPNEAYEVYKKKAIELYGTY